MDDEDNQLNFNDFDDEIDEEWLDWLNGVGAPPEVPLPDTPPTASEPLRPQLRPTEEIIQGLRRRMQYSDSEEEAPGGDVEDMVVDNK